MTRGEQMKAVSKLATSLLIARGAASGTTRTLTAAMGAAEGMVPVLSLSAQGVLTIERVAVPAGQAAAAVGTGVGGVYVLSGIVGEGDGAVLDADASVASGNGSEAGVPDKGGNRPIEPSERLVEKVVNSNMPHAAERAVERVGFSSIQEARAALQEFGRQLEKTGLPAEAVRDTAYADRFIVPGFGHGGAVVYQVKDGVLKLKTVLEWRPK